MKGWSRAPRAIDLGTGAVPAPRSGGPRVIHFARVAADGIRAMCENQDAASDWTTVAGIVTCPRCRSLLRVRAADAAR